MTLGSIPTPITTEATYLPIQTATDPAHSESQLDRINPPAGLVFLQECGINCEKSLWIISSSSKQLEIPFDGDDLAISSDHRFVLYQKDLDIWLLDLSNGDKRQITSTPDCWEENPAWSPDNKSIMFFGCGHYEQDDIYIFDLSTEEIINLTNTPDVQETCIDRYLAVCITEWSELSFMVLGTRKIEGVKDYGPRIPSQCHTMYGLCHYFPTVIFTESGKHQVLDQNSGIISPPAMSPNKEMIAYDGGHLYDLKTRIITTLLPSQYGTSPLLAAIPVHEDGPELIHPIWSPDGQQIVWVSHVGQDGKVGIIVFDLELHTANILYVYTVWGYGGGLPAWDRWPDSVLAWSADSKWLAFETYEMVESVEGILELQSDTLIYDRYGKQVVKWNLGGGVPVWSPDSKWLAINDFDPTTATSTILFAEIETLEIQSINIEGDLELIDWFSEQYRKGSKLYTFCTASIS